MVPNDVHGRLWVEKGCPATRKAPHDDVPSGAKEWSQAPYEPRWNLLRAPLAQSAHIWSLMEDLRSGID